MKALTLEEALLLARELIGDLRKVAEGAKRFDPPAEALYLRRAEAVELLMVLAEAPVEEVDLVDLVRGA